MIATEALVRYRIHVYGFVQGVGFRPYVYRLAGEMGLGGTVSNSTSGAFVEVEGNEEECRTFVERLRRCPPPAWVAGYELSVLDSHGATEFRILDSDPAGPCTADVLPDLATCPECQREMLDPGDRRYGYPFLNCTRCGPRFTIIEGVPYDRPNTTMRSFLMCDACLAEYQSPGDRRFHAQPTACPTCGPQLNQSVQSAAECLRRGQIVAIKGVGGFQLLVDACNEEAVQRLRQRKHREQKPFAVMFPTLDCVLRFCRVSEPEAHVLSSAAAPIVLLARNGDGLAPSVAACSPWMGAMLPYTPLHHLLLREYGGPLVATSGNRSDEPIAIEDHDAVDRLGAIADAFLLHDRPIARHADDSVVRVLAGREVVLRRARGYAPMPVRVRRDLPKVMALGAHLKSAVAIGLGKTVVLSQHIGDLDSPEARDAYAKTVEDLQRLYKFEPEVVACDLHPDYFSTRFAESMGCRTISIQHHHAHVAACAAENDISGDYLGVAWDGTGYGTDGTIWGGEFFAYGEGRFTRVAHLRPFRLPGGDRAIRDCRRSAASLLLECGACMEQTPFSGFMTSGAYAPVTTSMGRLFDAVAAITGIAYENTYEGQAAMLLEAAAACTPATSLHYEVPFEDGQLDWRPMVAAIAQDTRRHAAGEIALAFHEALSDAISRVANEYRLPAVVLSGGVFQNVLLVNMVRSRIDARTHWRVPPNDGGIAMGQAVLAGMLCA